VKAVVTGASGFVGRHLIGELQRRGDEPVAVARPGSGAADELEAAGIVVVREDLRRPTPALDDVLAGADVVYHLAAGVAGGWRATFDTNVTATENLVAAIDRSAFSGRVVHVSSYAVYAFNQLPPGAVVDESTPIEPEPWRRDDYSWTKVLQEQVVRRLEGGAAELVVVRPGTIYGRERRFHYRLGRPLGSEAILLLGGRNVLPLTYVENTVSLLAESGRHPAAAGETFNAVDPGAVTQLAYLRRWRAAADGPRFVLPFPLAALRAMGRALQAAERRTEGRLVPPAFLDPYKIEPTVRRFSWAPSRAKEVLGWEPPVALDEALRRSFS
jgi:nucleoside-diphosphate-sugar epimerase